MAKRKKKVVRTTNDEPLNSPFSELAGLRAELAGSAAEPEVPAGAPEPTQKKEGPRFGPKVVVRREKKGRGGKTVTRVSGLGIRGVELERLAKSLKNALGCGAIIEAEDILLQGAQGERVEAQLTALGVKRVIIAN